MAAEQQPIDINRTTVTFGSGDNYEEVILESRRYKDGKVIIVPVKNGGVPEEQPLKQTSFLEDKEV